MPGTRMTVAALWLLATMVVAVPAKSQEQGHALTAQDLEAWLDGYLPYALQTGDIAGAEIAVVKDGQVLAERGYGYADVAKRTAVDPKLTLFRPGSVSKLVTWTAVMQLVEQGKIDLDGDVNQYLDFKIAPFEGKPVTMRNLMQHTAGFEEQVKGIITYDPKSETYDKLLKHWVPHRIFAPGTTPAYSNYGASLAAYIVQRQSGQSFDDYLDEHIFAPLEMTHSTFRQPLPAELVPYMSKGYRQASDPPIEYEIVGPAPAGALASPAEDMAHFMIAHLQDGEYHGKRILKAETAQQMHDSPLTTLPSLNRMELGFFETNVNGHEVIGHLGDTEAFHTSLHLFIKDGVGLYASFNSPGKDGAVQGLRTALFNGFADRYFPQAAPHAGVDARTAAQHAAMLQGSWINSRESDSNFLKAVGLIGQVKVGVDEKGGLVVPPFTGLNGKPRHWVELEPFVWRDPDNHERLAAKVVDGKAVRFSIDLLSPFMVFYRAPWYEDAAWLVPAVCAAAGALLLTVLFWPVTALVRRRYGAKLALPPQAMRAYRLGKLAALVIVAALGLWAFTVSGMLKDNTKLTAAFDGMLGFVQVFGTIAILGGFAALAWNLWVVWTGKRRWPAKCWSVVLVASAMIVLWVAIAGKLLGLNLDY
jgi:CubicO group peptidase (beta-lactamase class C family)